MSNDEPLGTPDPAESAADPSAESDPAGLEALLDYIHRNRGFDFTGYKRTTLARRIRRRMQAIGVETYTDYIDHLEVRTDEFPQLFNIILINVTGFFRDPAAWDALRELLVERIDTSRGAEPFRVWCAGCASGEEPYTVAMVLAELLGADGYAERVKIYATDVDEEALAQARAATYPQKAVEGVPQSLLEKYFTPAGASFVFNKDLRRGVIFGRHDLVQDAPISRIDMLTCRNTMMYFNAETQTRILGRLHFGLNDGGILFLGKAEMLLTHGNLFSPIDLKLRIFARTKGRTRDRALHVPVAGDEVTQENRDRLYRAAFERGPTAQLTLDSEGHVALINHRAAHLFALTLQDVGRPFHDLEVSYRPAELRSCLDRVRKERRPMHLHEVERVTATGDATYLDIEVVPLLAENGEVIGTQLSFADITDAHRLNQELRKTNLELETAHEELQSTGEELETTNEELQSTVEELETTNEELQSTNEELETMNEELQATNEELQAMNEELSQRGAELVKVEAFHDAVLASMRPGIAVLDRDLLVRTWNPKMEDLWGVRYDEVVGRQFLTLDIGLPTEQIAGAIRTSLSTGETAERAVECTNRRGRKVSCKVLVSAVRSELHEGVTVVVEECLS